MITPREIVFPLRLTPAEMHILLSLIKAKQLLGADSARLFPVGAAERERLWMQGQEDLERDGWLIKLPEGEQYHLNDQLAAIIASMADPEMVVVTRCGVPGQAERGVSHYIASEAVVEQAFDGQIYLITVLTSPGVMAARLANVFSLPAASPLRLTFELSQEEAKRAKSGADSGWLAERGVPEQAAQSVAAALRNPSCYGTLHLLRARQGKAVEERLLGLAVQDDMAAWLAMPVAEGHVRYVGVDAASFVETVLGLLAELRGSGT